MVNEALIEEMLADLEQVTRQFECFGDRWGKYGESLQSRLSDQQRQRVEDAFGHCLKRLNKVCEE